MAYHLACYPGNSTVKGAKARYASKCQECKLAINPGDLFTWTRNGSTDTTPATPPTTGKSILDLDALAEEMLNRLSGRIEAATTPVHHTIEITINESEPIDCGLQHTAFPLLMKAVAAGVNVWLAGPSGSGKTHAAQAISKALGLRFYYCGAVGDAFALLGYMNAEGKLVRTPFREAYEHGGIFLIDEVDASDPNALLAFNAALANGKAAFPDGIVTRHKDCKIIAAANTWGHGANHEYVGRNKLDMAFLKRFAFISWQYDENLEMATAPNLAWTKRVQEIRAKVTARGLRVLVTPRESYIGAALLAAGIEQSEVEAMTIKSGMTEDQWKSLQ